MNTEEPYQFEYRDPKGCRHGCILLAAYLIILTAVLTLIL